MFCTRCQQMVPDFIWIDNDHPMLLPTPMVVRREDELIYNQIKFTAEIMVQKERCSEVYRVVNIDSNPKVEESTPAENVDILSTHPFVKRYPPPSS